MEKLKNKAKRNILVAFMLNLFFSILEFFGGLFTNSVAIMSDAIHDFGDAMSLAIAYFLESKSDKKPDANYTFGYARYSILGAFITSIILVCGSIYAMYQSVIRLANPQEVNYDGMLYLAIVGLIINGAGAFLTSKGKKINERVVSLHLLEDLFGWIAVIFVSIIIKFTQLYILDSILSLVIAIFILYNVYKNLKSIIDIVLEKKPSQINTDKLKEHVLASNEKIKEIHHIHIWNLDELNIFITMHAVLENDVNIDECIIIKQQIKEELGEFGINHSIIEIERAKDHCDNKECEIQKDELTNHHHHHHHDN